MPIVKVKDKFQITVPVTLRARLALKVGDLLEAEIKNGVLELSPKDLVNREIDLARAQIKAGQYLGPFETAEEGARALRRHAKSRSAKAPARTVRRRTA
jgi:AbrB family looped-hinge helix DNA binding protein